MDAQDLWKRYRRYLCEVDSLKLALDISGMHFDEGFLVCDGTCGPARFRRNGHAQRGAIAKSDEQRMVWPLLAACAATRAG